MTRADKPVTRETYSRYQARPVVVSIHATYISVRLKGTQKRFTIDAVAAYQFAARLEAEARRREKRAAAKKSA